MEFCPKNYFLQQLQEAKEIEKLAAEKICKRNNVTVLHFCDDFRYDFITSDNIKYEVKHDKVSVLTGNFFIECASDGKPSGILTTDAQYYIIVSGDIYYLVPTETIKQLVHDKKYIRTVSTKITNKTDGFIFNKDTIIQHCAII